MAAPRLAERRISFAQQSVAKELQHKQRSLQQSAAVVLVQLMLGLRPAEGTPHNRGQ